MCPCYIIIAYLCWESIFLHHQNYISESHTKSALSINILQDFVFTSKVG